MASPRVQIQDVNLVFAWHCNLGFTGTANLSSDRAVVDFRIVAWWARETGWKEGIDTSAAIPDREKVRLGKWSDEEGEWQAWIQCDAIPVEGNPMTEAREVETPRGVQAVDESRTSFVRSPPRTLENGLVTRTFSVQPDFLQQLGNEAAGLPDLIDAKDARVFPGRRWIDAREALRSYGVRLSTPGSAAGFQPDRGILTVVGNATEVDTTEMVLPPIRCYPPFVDHALEAPGITANLRGRSGAVAGILRSRHGESRELFRIATNVGANGRLMDVDYVLNLEGDVHLDSASTITTGEPQEIGLVMSDGQPNRFTLTATIHPFLPE